MIFISMDRIKLLLLHKFSPKLVVKKKKKEGKSQQWGDITRVGELVAYGEAGILKKIT